MAYYAFLDENNIVTEVIVGKDETQFIDGLTTEEWYGNYRNQICLRTSFNTFGNKHQLGKIPFRKNYAGIGYTWDGTGFAPPQTFPSWILNAETYLWESPVPMPTDEKNYRWDESTLSWIELPETPIE
jgi:hypothetical protein